jgi:hypothetical protein
MNLAKLNSFELTLVEITPDEGRRVKAASRLSFPEQSAVSKDVALCDVVENTVQIGGIQ